MNWGKGLIIGMVLFMAFIITLVSLLISKRVDLVSEDYYKQEIAYESELTAMDNWKATGKQLSLKSDESNLIVQLPEVEGIHEYRLSLSSPNDHKQDLFFRISGTSTYLIARDKLRSGVYNYRLECERAGKNYLETGQYYFK